MSLAETLSRVSSAHGGADGDAAVTGSPPAASGGEPEAAEGFAGELLLAHNAARARHGAAPLRACAALGLEARAWAEHLLERRALKHSDTSHGENLYYRPLGARGQGNEPGGKEVTEYWYSELKHYDFSCPGYKPNTVHFTQLVWRASCRLGVGRACDGRRLIVVTLYSPPGNQGPQGAFRANVLPPCPVPPPLPVLPVLAVPPPLAVLLPPLPSDEAPCPVLPPRGAPPASPDATEAEEAGSEVSLQASSFQQDMLLAHNALRRRHGVRPLVLSAELCAGAQLRAEALLLLLMDPHGSRHRDNGSHEMAVGLADPMWPSELQTASTQAEQLQSGTFIVADTGPQADEAQPGSVTIAEEPPPPVDKLQPETVQAVRSEQDNKQPDHGSAGSSRVDIAQLGETQSRGAVRGSAGQPEDSRGKPPQPTSPNEQGQQPDKREPGKGVAQVQPERGDVQPERMQTERSHQSKSQGNKAQREDGLPANKPRPDKDSPDELEPKGAQPYQLQPAGLQSNEQPPARLQSNESEADKILSNEALPSRELQPAELQPSVVEGDAAQAEVAQVAGRPPDADGGARSLSWDAVKLERAGREESRPGENIYVAAGSDAARCTASDVTDAWYSDIGQHNFDILGPQPESARFCQLVWRSSRRLGVGRALGPRGCVVVVAAYDPPALWGDMTAPVESYIPETKGAEPDSGEHAAGSAGGGDVRATLAPEVEPVATADTSLVSTGDGESEKSILIRADGESDTSRIAGGSTAERAATDASTSACPAGVGANAGASSELAPKESVPKSVSFFSLEDTLCTTAPSMRSDDTDVETEESSGTETLVMDSERTTYEIMDISEADAVEELPWARDTVGGGAGSNRRTAAGCQEIGSEDGVVSKVLVAEKLTAASSPTGDTDRGGEEKQTAAGKGTQQVQVLPHVASGGGTELSNSGVVFDKTKRRHSDVENGTLGRMTVEELTGRRSSGATKVVHGETRVKGPGESAKGMKCAADDGGVKFAPPAAPGKGPKVAAKAGRRADASALGAASGSKVMVKTPRAEVVPSKVVGTEVLIKATLVGDALQELYRRNVLPIVRSTPCTPQPHAQLHISEEDQEAFLVDMLAEHNRLRELHGTRPLRRSVALSRDARAWARVLARSRALRSHPTVPHGQNVWAKHIGTGELPKGRKVTNCWYADRLVYDYNNPGFQQGTGNFSQLVWRSSLDLGVGLACDGRGMFVAVAFYSPAGNLPYAMSYRDNVLPPHIPGQG